MSDKNPPPATNPTSPPPSKPIPRGPRVSYLIALLVVAGLMLWLGVSHGEAIRAGLAKMVGTGSAAGSDANASQVQWWTCGMHPQVMLPKPGDCPICHMALVPYKPSDNAGNTLTINPVISQDIGVRITDVTTGPVTRIIRTVGTVENDETTVRDLTVKVGGWIEKLYVNYVGEAVAKGQPLFDIYSPDLYTAQQEYLNTYRNTKAAATAPAQGDGNWGADLLEAGRKRLEYYDISAAQIAEMERTGKASKTMTIKSPYRGLVLNKNIVEGAKVDSGSQLYRIADLTRVWVIVTLYEYQLPYIQVGLKATMTLPYIPGQAFEGKITYIYPVINTEARQARMRLEVDNPSLVLKPGMYANVEIQNTLAQHETLVPREAVIDTGERKIAFVSLGDGQFEPRSVKLGVESEGGLVQVIDGLKPGEKVVTSGQFLLDSEARLSEARAKMIRGTLAADQKTVATVAGAAELSSLPPEAARQLTAILDGYFAAGDKLSADSIDGLAEPSGRVASAAATLVTVDIADAPSFWRQHAELAQVGGKAKELAKDANIADAREHFADLSIALSKLLHATGVPPAYGREVQEMHCPMYREGQGGNIWLQPAGKVRNPFFGASMLECFDRKTTLPTTTAERK